MYRSSRKTWKDNWPSHYREGSEVITISASDVKDFGMSLLSPHCLACLEMDMKALIISEKVSSSRPCLWSFWHSCLYRSDLGEFESNPDGLNLMKIFKSQYFGWLKRILLARLLRGKGFHIIGDSWRQYSCLNQLIDTWLVRNCKNQYPDQVKGVMRNTFGHKKSLIRA